jgi:hypothetical protein
MKDESTVISYYVPNSKMFDVHCTQFLGFMQNTEHLWQSAMSGVSNITQAFDTKLDLILAMFYT